MIKFVITSFKELISLVDSGNKFALVSMFKSHRCPPCISNANYLNTLTSNGDTQWQKHAYDFQKVNHIPIYFFAIDASSQLVIENHSQMLNVISAANTVSAVPTFDFFLCENQHLKYFKQARRTGGMGSGSFDIYLDSCANFINK